MTAIPISTRNEIRRQIIAIGRRLVGTPFKHQGRLPGKALDCVGLIACIGRELNLFKYDRTNYNRLPSGDRLIDACNSAGFVEIPIATALPGDIYLMRFDRDPQHVALVSDIGLIHAYMQANKVVEHRLDDVWRARILRAYRFPGVE